MEFIRKYFPELSRKQFQQFELLQREFLEWNSKINLISRKDEENFEERHILHSLSIAKVIKFSPGTQILDLGTGGGFPGLPLAIFFPEVQFTMADSIGKKIMVVNDLIDKLELSNAKGVHTRAEQLKDKYDFVTNRAVAPVTELLKWSQNLISQKHRNTLPNGLLCLKGGDLKEELKPFKKYSILYPIKDYYKEEFFETKYVVYVQG